MGILDRILRAGEGKKLKALEGLVPDINAHEVAMKALAARDEIELILLSSYRSLESQAHIIERKLKLEQPLELAFIDASTAAERGDASAFTRPAADARAYLNAYFSLATLRAAKAAEGDTTLHRVYHLDRGFETLEDKLAACGAEIERIRKALRRAIQI